MASELELKLLKEHNLPYYLPYKKVKIDQFFIGLFGALAVFGVLMKLWKEPFWGLVTPETGKILFEIFMPIGFLGESIVFIIMGFMKGEEHVEIFPDQFDDLMDEQSGKGNGSSDNEQVVVNLEMPESLTELLEDKATNQLDSRVSELTNLLVEDVEKTRGLLSDTNEVNQKLQVVSESLGNFSENLVKISDDLQGFDSKEFSDSAESMTKNLKETEVELGSLKSEMMKLSERFNSFNNPTN